MHLLNRCGTRVAAIAVVMLAGASGALGAQDVGEDEDAPAPTAQATAGGVVYDGRAGQLDVRPPRIEDASLDIDGRLDEPEWRRAAVLTGFSQYEPNEGVPSAEPTEIRIFYAPDAIYFGVHAYDSRPDLIPAIVGRRDQGIFSDDWVRIMVDTYDDERQAYLFYVNPLGIQADGLWLEGTRNDDGRPPVDFNPDFIWESRGAVVEDGWMAEIRVPFTSLQFAEGDGRTWRVNFAREVRRLGYKQSWAPITADLTSTLAQSGRLLGMEGLAASRLIELNPVMTSRVAGEAVDGVFARGPLEPELGFDGRYGVTRNLTLGGTFNPDFSQVEADADQITVNERFAVFFEEKRPFFLDGTEVFQSPTRLVHTRQIVDPVGGAKLTGKVGGLNLGYLGAVDESPLVTDSTGRALFNMARLRADVGAGSALGVLFTDRSVPGEGIYNRVAAADARLLLGRRLSVTAQYAGSWSRESPADASAFGALWYASLRQIGRTFGFEVTAEDVSPDFRTETGFIRRLGDVRTRAQVNLNSYLAPGSTLERIGFELAYEGFFDHADLFDGVDRRPFEFEIEGRTSFNFRGNRSINVILRNGYFRFRPGSYESYEVLTGDGGLAPFEVPDPLTSMWAGGFFTDWRVSETIQLGGRFFIREVPIFSAAARGLEILFGPELTLRPTDSWEIALEYELSRITRQGAGDDRLFSSADIPRLNTQYQFTRALFARVILQYDLAERVALTDPGTGRPLFVEGERADAVSSGEFLSQVLLSYEPSPRTVFFIGWSRQMAGERGFGLGRMDLITEGFFAKLSYLLRL